jgi:HD-GYP domain-containing protein (c-di-GMP phosphodiesterase class II)
MQEMTWSDLPFEREELKTFLQSLSKATGLSLSYFPPGEDMQDLVIGESTFCLQLMATMEGAARCRKSIEQIRRQAVSSGSPKFDLCHARMGEVVVPLVAVNGEDLGTVMVGQALIQGMTREHKEFIRDLAGELGVESTDELVASAGDSTVFTRSRLEALGEFISHELLEKVSSRHAIEDTTEYLLQKYEELMFLYAITETITLESGHQKPISVILDKGLQKLGASWGLLMLKEENDPLKLQVIQAAGCPLLTMEGELDRSLTGRILRYSEPVLIKSGQDFDPPTDCLLVVPFQVRNLREGFLVFGCRDEVQIKDAGMKFAVALARQASTVLYAVHLYRELADLLFATLAALSSAIDAKDPYTHGHSKRVAEYAVKTARYIGYDSKALTMMKITGQLHDFGKIGIREQILSKNGRLDKNERKAMEEHPVIGAQILARFKPFHEIVPGVRHHHERYDGTGYPDGLKGEDIPEGGRIIAVADAYDAMTSHRPYRKELHHQEALVELRTHAGDQFDPAVVDAFIHSIGEGKIG